MTMERPKNPRDTSGEGGDRLTKRPRTENNAPSNSRMTNRFARLPPIIVNSGVASNRSASSFPSSSNSGSLFGSAQRGFGNRFKAYPRPAAANKPPGLPSAAATPSNPSQTTKTNESKSGIHNTTGNSFKFGFGFQSSPPSTSGGSVPPGLVQKDTPRSVPSTSVKPEGVTVKQEQASSATAANAQPTIKPNPVAPNVEVFHVRGDLTLVAGQQGIKFRISSQSLAIVSLPWQNKIDGPLSGKTSQHGEDGWVMRLPADNPEALRIVLQVIHYKFDALPSQLSCETVFHLTVLCDKYDMVGLLKPFWGNWVAKLPAHPTLNPKTFVQQVWIAHKLGHMQLYERNLNEFLCSAHKRSSVGKTRLFLENYPDFDFYNDPHLSALGIFDTWEHGRLRLIRQVKAELDYALRNLSNPKNTNCSYASSEWQMTCDCAMLGGVHRALHGKSWYSSGANNWESLVTISVRQLATKLEGVRTAAIGESKMRKKQGDVHKTCTPWDRFELADILKACPVGAILSLKQAAFKEQAQKSGLVAFAAPTPVVSTAKHEFGKPFNFLDMFGCA